MLLFPRLGAMSLDTIERVKYFGLRSVRTCGICRLRKGRSVTRVSTRHVPDNIEQMYIESTADVSRRPLISRRKRFREQLARHGFDHTKRCRLTQHAKHCLVNIPEFQPIMFGGLVRYEAMHVYYINFCSWLLEALVKCVPKENYVHVEKMVSSCHQFRNTTTGTAYPRLRSILRLTHYTAERRVMAIFYWAHVLGLHGEVLVPECRRHAQCAVAALQLILICTRGHRSYTPDELTVIFKDTGRQFFMHLEALAQYSDNKRVQHQQKKYDKDPQKNPKPAPWKRVARFTSNNTNCMSTNILIFCIE